MCAKFLAGETTVFSQFRDDVPLTWPTVILCPGKSSKVTRNDVHNICNMKTTAFLPR